MKQQDPFRNSELDRSRAKRHFFHSLISDKIKRHRSDTGLVEDRTSSVTIVRIIVGLLMIHLIIIGGVLLRGQMVKESSGIAAPASITPPPSPIAPPAAPAPTTSPIAPPPAATAHQTAAAPDALPRPTAPATPASAHPATAANHITQAVEEESAEEPEDEPIIVSAPVVAQTPAEPIRHLVARGDTWHRIAAQYNTTEAALKAANPTQAQGVLRAGATLSIPTGNATAGATAQKAAPAAAATPAATASAPATPSSGAKVYTVQRGETLSRISRKVKIPMKELMQINGIKDANRITPGMQLRLSR